MVNMSSSFTVRIDVYVTDTILVGIIIKNTEISIIKKCDDDDDLIMNV